MSEAVSVERRMMILLAAEVETATIVTILPDRGDKYLSTGLFRV